MKGRVKIISNNLDKRQCESGDIKFRSRKKNVDQMESRNIRMVRNKVEHGSSDQKQRAMD